MKKTFNYLLFSLAFLLLSSCGKDVPETTAVSFFSGAIISNLQDAVIVAVRVNDGKKMSFHADPLGMSMTLPNGVWRFYGYGWEGTYNSQARCAFGGYTTTPIAAYDIDLNGVATSINMDFTVANCGFPSVDNVFHQMSQYVESTNFANLRVYFCSGPVLTGVTTSCINGSTSYASLSGSYMQIRVAGFADIAMGLEVSDARSLKSQCISIIAGANDTAMVLPPGSPSIYADHPFGFIVDVFPSSLCNTAPTKSIYLENGASSAQFEHSSLIHLEHNTVNTDLFLDYTGSPNTTYTLMP